MLLVRDYRLRHNLSLARVQVSTELPTADGTTDTVMTDARDIQIKVPAEGSSSRPSLPHLDYEAHGKDEVSPPREAPASPTSQEPLVNGADPVASLQPRPYSAA